MSKDKRRPTNLDRYEEQRASAAARPMFVWDGRYETGLLEIDDQHRRLVDIINHVDRLLRVDTPLEVLTPILDELTEYARYHFATEERMMDSLRLNASHVSRHKRAHADFNKQVGLMHEQAKLSPTEFIPSLLRFLSTWLVHHILTIDQAFARQVFAVRGGAAADHAARLAGDQPADPASEALLDAIHRLYDDVARRNVTLAQLNEALRAREGELQTVQDELYQANRDLEQRLKDGERQIAESRAVFQAQNAAHQHILASGQVDGVARDIGDAIRFTAKNLESIEGCVADLFRVIEEYEKVHAPSVRADDVRRRHDVQVLERLRQIVFEMLAESRERLAQAGELATGGDGTPAG